jgi:hypothetical protein
VPLERLGHDEVWAMGVWLHDRLVRDGIVGAVAAYLGDQHGLAAEAVLALAERQRAD